MSKGFQHKVRFNDKPKKGKFDFIETRVSRLILDKRYQVALDLLIFYEQANRKSSEINILKGIVYEKLNRLQDACNEYHSALSKSPLNADIWINLGNVYAKLKVDDSAYNAYKKALSLCPDNFLALKNFCNFLLEKNYLDDALIQLSFWLKLDASNPSVHAMLGYCYFEKNNYLESRNHLETSLKLDPYDFKTLARLANLSLHEKRYARAKAEIDNALRLDSSSPLVNLIAGNIYHSLGYYNDSYKYLVNASLDPGTRVNSQFNLSLVAFATGNRELGYELFSNRFLLSGRCSIHASTQFPIFKETQKSETLYLFSEQGLGDTVQFVRYAKWFINKGLYTNVKVFVQDELLSLLSYSMPSISFLSNKTAPVKIKDQALPLLSVPQYFGEQAENQDIHEHYLSVSSERISYWKNQLQASNPNDFLIAICWQGNPKAEKTSNIGRSIPLDILLEIGKVNGIKFVSLQKGTGSEQLSDTLKQAYFVGCQDQISNALEFEDSAAIIESCNLVISVDTCIAHICGGLGKPLWLLLSFVPDWRWGANGEFCFWYKSMITFQQKRLGDWHGVVQDVIKRLKPLVLNTQTLVGT